MQLHFDQDQDTTFGNRLFRSYVLHVDDAHEIQFFSTKFFQICFFFRIRIRIPLAKSITKVMLFVLNVPTKFGVVPQSFFLIKILFKMKIRIRIMILLCISIPDLHFIHRRHPPNFVWIR